MSNEEKTKAHLEALAEDLYQEGYMCGIDEPDWFKAWAMAMLAVCGGDDYTQTLVIDCYKKITDENPTP